uniref:Uncharacterized protein n=1 Tax=viral metagenome TaxID=1070528 RepID=A0A6C0D295_9ZZZZ
MKRVEPSIHPIVTVNHHDYRIAFLFQAIFTSLVVTMALIMIDMMTYLWEYYHPHTKCWYMKYIIYSICYFLGTLFIIYVLLWVFGYGICLMPPMFSTSMPSSSLSLSMKKLT